MGFAHTSTFMSKTSQSLQQASKSPAAIHDLSHRLIGDPRNSGSATQKISLGEIQGKKNIRVEEADQA
jgi:hypothetical protein